MRPDEKHEANLDKTIEEIKNEPIGNEMTEKAGQRVWARISRELAIVSVLLCRWTGEPSGQIRT